jgi:hypothetical protein
MADTASPNECRRRAGQPRYPDVSNEPRLATAARATNDTFSIAMNIAPVTLLDERLNPRSTERKRPKTPSPGGPHGLCPCIFEAGRCPTDQHKKRMPVQSNHPGWEEPDMTPGPCFRYPGTGNQPGATSMGDDDRRFAEIFAELHALRLIVNEVFSMVLSLEADPANAVVTARKHITETIERAETRPSLPDQISNSGCGMLARSRAS